MRIVIAGGHGRVALLLGRRLVDEGHEVTGLVRNPEHFDDLREVGVKPRLFDIEVGRLDGLVDQVRGHDTAVFAAGSGAGSGAARKETVDFAAAVKFTDACVRGDVHRLIMLSSMGADEPPMDNETMSVYLRAKRRADDHLRDTTLDWTIVRPGPLTNDEPTGRVTVGAALDPDEVPRGDVAHVLAAVAERPQTIGRILEVTAGDVDVATALAESDTPDADGRSAPAA